ncbi:MAG: DUF927 domain-containing protein [Desulfovibrio sp.]|jgi:putative DNA primase/helicase|nr:DUF927 domain-containing protein [Desulfovibrio sp.]
MESIRRYADPNFNLLALQPGSKVPVRGPWRAPESGHVGNIGMVVGREIGILAIDVDGLRWKDDGTPEMEDGVQVDAHGRETLERLQQELGPLPDTLVQRTGSGGRHLIYKHPDVPLKGILGPGVDVKGADGKAYIVVEPSIHPCGNRYAWENWGTDIADLPPAWVEYLRKDGPKGVAIAPAPVDALFGMASGGDSPERKAMLAILPAETVSDLNGLRPYVRAAVLGEMHNVATAPDGFRNITFNNAALALGHYGTRPDGGGYLQEELARGALHAAWRQCHPDGDDGSSEFDSTFASGWAAGLKEPRDIPANAAEDADGAPAGVPGFFWASDGSLWGSMKVGTGKRAQTIPVRVCQPFEVLGGMADTDSFGCGVAVRFAPERVEEDVTRTVPLKYTQLRASNPSAWMDILEDGGFDLSSNTTHARLLANYLIDCPKDRFLLSVSKTGWPGTLSAFVLPNGEIIGQSAKPLILASPDVENICAKGGTSDGWRDTIGTWANGNSRLMFALCWAFAAPLAEPAGMDGGGVNLFGTSRSGKTTVHLAAASVYGKGSPSGGYVSTWRTTDNFLEPLAALHNNMLLCLDEMSVATPEVLAKAAFMFSMGQGKGRMRDDTSARKPLTFNVLWFSTNECRFEDMVRQCNARNSKTEASAGQLVRIVDIPADAGKGMGVFEDLHVFESPEAFANAIRQAARTHHGHAFRAYLQWLVDKPGVEAIPRGIGQVVGMFGLPKDASGQVKYVASMFALAAIGGTLATAAGIVPWAPGHAFQTCQRIFHEWLDDRGAAGDTEDQRIRERMRDFIAQHGESRFQDVNGFSDRPVPNRAGCRRTERETGQTTYYVFPEVFRKEIMDGLDYKRAQRILHDDGVLISKEKNNGSPRYACKPGVTLPGLGNTQRVYIIRYPDPDMQAIASAKHASHGVCWGQDVPAV